MLLNLTVQNYQTETIERFLAYVESLMIELEELPTEEYLFGWVYRNFCQWAPVRETFRLAYRNPAGYPSRCCAYLWYKVVEKIQWTQIEANKKAHDLFVAGLAKLPPGHHASLWGNTDGLQKVAPVNQTAPSNKKGAQQPPATGGGGKPPAPATAQSRLINKRLRI